MRPSGRRATISVNVPPRSIQNCQRGDEFDIRTERGASHFATERSAVSSLEVPSFAFYGDRSGLGPALGDRVEQLNRGLLRDCGDLHQSMARFATEFMALLPGGNAVGAR